MSKKVSDMAGEFGIPTDEVMTLLRQMDVAVRGPASVLADDQVSRVRLRWEREKRHRAEKQSAPERRARSSSGSRVRALPTRSRSSVWRPDSPTTRPAYSGKLV